MRKPVYVHMGLKAIIRSRLATKKIEHKIVFIYIRFGCSKELSHWDGSVEYSQHMFWLRNKKTSL